MGDFNKVMILGRLTRDPEVRYTPSGTPVCDISLAVGRRIGGGESGQERREETTYIDVTLWDRRAELAGQYLSKGRELFVEGRLTTESWEDKTTGQKRSKTKVVCENMQFVGGGGGGNNNSNNSYGGNQGGQQNSGNQNNSYGGGAAPQQQSPPPRQQSAPAEPQFEPEGEEDDIPF